MFQKRKKHQAGNHSPPTFPWTNAAFYSFILINCQSVTDRVERSKFVNVLWSPAGASRKETMTMSFCTEKALMSLGALGSFRIQARSMDELEERTDTVEEHLLFLLWSPVRLSPFQSAFASLPSSLLFYLCLNGHSK